MLLFELPWLATIRIHLPKVLIVAGHLYGKEVLAEDEEPSGQVFHAGGDAGHSGERDAVDREHPAGWYPCSELEIERELLQCKEAL